LVLLALVLVSSPAPAQLRLGAFLGAEHESSWDEFLLVGVEARARIVDGRVVVAPRFSYFIREATTRLQVDLNLLKPLAFKQPSAIKPYLGIGASFESVSFDGGDGDSAVGLNYVMGGAYRLNGPLQPYAQFQYSFFHEAFNVAVVTLGILYRLGGAPEPMLE
jgi:hypothetical protein